jgi:hypothetical protein
MWGMGAGRPAEFLEIMIGGLNERETNLSGIGEKNKGI